MHRNTVLFQKIAAVLLVLVLVMATTFGSMSASGASTMKMSEVMNYFAANQVTYFNLDLNTGLIDLSLKEGEYPLPEEAETQQQAAGGLKRLGYTQVKNIGGIAAWKGKVER